MGKFDFNGLLRDGVSSAVGSGIGLLGSVIQNSQSKKLMDYQFEKQKEMYELQRMNMLQDNLNGALLQRQAKERAGLNVAEGGYSPNITVPSGSIGAMPTSPSASILEGMNSMANVRLATAQARNLNADAEHKEIDNSRRQHEDNYANYLINTMSIQHEIDSEGNIVLSNIDVVANKKHRFNLGDLNARIIANAFEGQQSDVALKKVYNEYQHKVAEGKLNDDKVINADIQLSYQEFKNLEQAFKKAVQETKLVKEQVSGQKTQNKILLTQKELTDLELTLRRDTNATQVLEKVFNSDASFADKAVVLLGWFLQSISMSIHN